MQIIVCILIHSSYFVLNLMLPAGRSNFARVASPIEHAEQACFRYTRQWLFKT